MNGLISMNFYDKLTHQIIAQHVSDGQNCIDIGTCYGSIMDMIVEISPNGHHFGFEPNPKHHNNLRPKYPSNVSLYNLALADTVGQRDFHITEPHTGYSGFIRRKMDLPEESHSVIQVQTQRLDNIIPNIPIRFIKIDTEGSELQVLKGSSRILCEYKPLVLFEFGIGAADCYEVTPEDMWDFWTKHKMSLYTLDEFLGNRSPLTYQKLEYYFMNNSEYMFIAESNVI